MAVTAIGAVRNGRGEPPEPRQAWREVVSEIVIEESLTDSLDGIEGFSHLIILWWMHRLKESTRPLRVHPGRRPGAPLTGVLATRAPVRPNPIGKATVRLLERRGNILKVEGLDALEGSPVIDIKPFIPAVDSAGDATVPSWVHG